jgi:hypothetical protein
MDVYRKESSSTVRRTLEFGLGYPSEIVWASGFADAVTGGYVTYSPYRVDSHKRRIREGIDCTTEMRAQHLNYSAAHHNYVLQKTNLVGQAYAYGFRGDIGAWLQDPSGLPSLSIDEADNIARENALKKILSVQRKFQSGVALGELAETIRLIRNPMGAIFEDTLQYCDTLRKRARIYKRLKDRRKLLTDSWLQYSFGVMPLFNDIQNAAEAAASIVTYKLPRETVTGRGSYSGKNQGPDLTEYIGHIMLKYRMEVRARTSVKYTAQVAVNNDTSADSLETLGLTWGNFLPTVWEVIPYSFLVDYFTNCGTVIDSLAVNEARINWCMRGSEISRVTAYGKYDVQIMDPPEGNMTYKWLEKSGATMPYYEDRSLTRDGGQPLPVPTLRFKLPFKSPKKVLNMAALLLAGKNASSALRI